MTQSILKFQQQCKIIGNFIDDISENYICTLSIIIHLHEQRFFVLKIK